MTFEQIPPGKYTDSQGVVRIWDGKEWLTPVDDSDPLNSPEMLASPEAPAAIETKPHRGRRWVVVAVAAVVVAILGTCSYFVISDRVDRQAAAAASASASAAAASQKADADKAASDAAQAATAATLAKDANDAALRSAEREDRAAQVKSLEKHVLKTAKQRVKSGYYSSKVIKSSCMAVTGSSIDDLDESSTTFSCMAVTSENKDGTYSGYEMSAVINWATGEMTWG